MYPLRRRRTISLHSTLSLIHKRRRRRLAGKEINRKKHLRAEMKKEEKTMTSRKMLKWMKVIRMNMKTR